MQFHFDSPTLRHLAEGIVGQIAADEDYSEVERSDLVTALVRQWATYDGLAAVLVGEHAYYLALGHSPLGKPSVHSEPGPKLWLRRMAADWNVDLEDLLAVKGELNLGQSAEVVTRDGSSIRLCVNPKERRFSIEPLVPIPPRPPGVGLNYHKIALNSLVAEFAGRFGQEETEALASSLVSQWQRCDGHACLIPDGNTEIHFKLTELADGRSNVTAQTRTVDVYGFLASLGIAAPEFPAVIAGLNLGRVVEYRTQEGARYRLKQDPRTRSLYRQPLDDVLSPTAAASVTLLTSCPHCSALVMPGPDGRLPTTCPLCGRAGTRAGTRA